MTDDEDARVAKIQRGHARLGWTSLDDAKRAAREVLQRERPALTGRRLEREVSAYGHACWDEGAILPLDEWLPQRPRKTSAAKATRRPRGGSAPRRGAGGARGRIEIRVTDEERAAISTAAEGLAGGVTELLVRAAALYARAAARAAKAGAAPERWLDDVAAAAVASSTVVDRLAAAAGERALTASEDWILRRLDPDAWDRLARDRPLTDPPTR